MGKKEVVLMDIYTKEQKTYESMTSLANEFGTTTTHISYYIKSKCIFRKKYHIFLKGDPILDIEDSIPYYLKNEKINMYNTYGEYIKTFDNIKEIRDYLIDKCCNGNANKSNHDYKHILKIIDKNNRKIYNYMFRSFKNNEDCKDIEPYRFKSPTGESKPVILMDIYTKNQKSYDSIASLEREFGLTHGYISSYIKKKHIFRKKYCIFPEDDPVANIEDIISNYLKDHPVPPVEEVPYYLKKEKINMYTKDGKYVNTFNNLKDIKDYLLDNCGITTYDFSYNVIIDTINKDNRSIFGYMFRWFKNNESCKNIKSYVYNKAGKCKEVILMDIYTKEQKSYDSITSLAKEFGVLRQQISSSIKKKHIFRKKYRIFLKEDVPNNNV